MRHLARGTQEAIAAAERGVQRFRHTHQLANPFLRHRAPSLW